MKPTPRDVRWLVDQLDDQKRRLKNLENRKPGLAYSSIEDGAIREYDKDGVLGSQTGKQSDGTHGNVVLNGPKPPKPTDPAVTAVPGTVELRWNGKFADGVVSPLDLKHVAGYVVPVGEVLDLSKQAGVMTGELGDNVQVQVEAGVYNVYLVAWSKAGRFSDAAGPVPVLVPVAADVDAIQAALDDLDLRYDGVITEAGNLGVRLDTAETDIAGAETRLDEAGTRLDTVFGQVSAVDGKATAASTAASSAQSKADSALTMAGSKSKVFYSDNPPSGTATLNDVWRQRNATKDIIGEWYWDAGWVKTLVSSQAISNLDVGKLTVGTGIISDLVAEHIAGRSARFIQLDVSQLVAVTGTMSEAVITKLFTDVVMSRKITAEMVAIGSFENLIPDDQFATDAGKIWYAPAGGTGSGFSSEVTYGSSDKSAVMPLKTGNPSTGALYAPYLYPEYRVPVSPGEVYYITSWAYLDASSIGNLNTVQQRVYHYATKSGAIINSMAGASITSPPLKTWFRVGGLFTVPAGSYYIAPRLTMYYPNNVDNTPAGGRWFMSAPKMVRANGGELIVDGGVKALQIDTQDLAANTGFIADLTARIVKSDMFVGKEFIGGIFTGSTFQTSILPDRGLKLDDTGFRAYGSEGGEPVAEIRPDGGTVYSVTDPATGDTLAGLDAEGGVTGKSLNIEGEAIIGGSPIVGGTNVDSFSTDYGQGILDYMPRAMVARGYRDTTGLAVTNGERAFLELSYDNLPNRAYQIHITPTAIYVPPNGGYTYLNIRHTRDGSRPTLDSPLLHRVSARNGGSGSLLTTFGGTFYDLGAAGKVRYLFSWEAIDGQSTFFGGAGATFRAWVEDIGYAVPETGLGRGDSRSNGSGGTTVTPAPPAPSTPEPENYTQVWTPSGYRSYDGNSHYGYADGKNRMYQGDGPATGMLRSIATFGGGSRGQTITQALSGATVTSMTVEITFPHWYIGAGGTAQLTVHGQTSLPSSLPFVTLAATRAKIPRGGRVKFSIPSNRWNEFKSGSLRGIGLGNGGGGNAYYGYAKGSTVKLEIKYTK